MKIWLLVALLWCAIGQAAFAKESGTWVRNGWQPYTAEFVGQTNAYREEREHWLRSRLKFSGKTRHSSDGRDGALGVAAEKILSQKDLLGFHYQDKRSHEHDTDTRAASFRYQTPAGANQVQIELGRSHYDRAVTDGFYRVNASGSSSMMGLGANRPLFSRFGLNFDGVARHRERGNVAFEEGQRVSESRYEVSSLGLEASGGHELSAGLMATSRLLAVSGRERHATDYVFQDDTGDSTSFYKVAMSASLEQQLFQWTWRVNGRYQFADDDLPVSEYLTVAGPSMLTGFNGQSVAAVRGGWLRLDTLSPLWQVPFVDGVLSSINFAVLQGWVPFTGVQADRHGRASAGQVSLRLQGRAFTANVSVGRMIRASTMAMAVPDHPDVRFSLSMGI